MFNWRRLILTSLHKPIKNTLLCKEAKMNFLTLWVQHWSLCHTLFKVECFGSIWEAILRILIESTYAVDVLVRCDIKSKHTLGRNIWKLPPSLLFKIEDLKCSHGRLPLTTPWEWIQESWLKWQSVHNLITLWLGLVLTVVQWPRTSKIFV